MPEAPILGEQILKSRTISSCSSLSKGTVSEAIGSVVVVPGDLALGFGVAGIGTTLAVGAGDDGGGSGAGGPVGVGGAALEEDDPPLCSCPAKTALWGLEVRRIIGGIIGSEFHGCPC